MLMHGLMHVLNSSRSSLGTLLISAIFGPVTPSDMSGFWPGLTRDTNGVVDNVACTALDKVRNSVPSCPCPLFECTDAELVLSIMCSVATIS